MPPQSNDQIEEEENDTAKQDDANRGQAEVKVKRGGPKVKYPLLRVACPWCERVKASSLPQLIRHAQDEHGKGEQ